MLSYQILVNGKWFHCEDHGCFHNHPGQRRIVSLTPQFFAELCRTGELSVLSPSYAEEQEVALQRKLNSTCA